MHPTSRLCRYFSYLDLVFRVRADSAEHLDWLEEFLYPAYSVSHAEKSWDIDVQIDSDQAYFEALYGKGPTKPETSHAAFVLDTSVLELPGWRSENAPLTLYQESTRTFFEFSHDRRQVRLSSTDIPRCRVPLMRALREFTMNHYMQIGGVFLHASAVSLGDDGLLIAGSKNAGKTSMMTHFLRNARANYIANDRVYINPNQQPLSMRGMPTIASIRTLMPPLFPGMQEQLEESVYQYHRTLAECRQRDSKLEASKGIRYLLSPAQLLDLHASSAAPCARPRAMLFPRVDPQETGIRAVPLSKSEISNRISDALYGISTLGTQQPEVFNLTGQPLPIVEELLHRCQRIAESLRCFEILLGRSAYESSRDTEVLLTELLD